MSRPVRLGISGAGRVFERLYLPAIRSAPGLHLAAVADPVAGRCSLAGPGVACFASLAELLDGAAVDAVAILSPPASHVADASLVLERGLPVLVEKPLCASIAETVMLRARGAETWLTPALSRRYWPTYQRIAAARPIRDLKVAIAVDPAGWGAHTGPADIAEDLFPHVADLARWLTSAEISTVSGRRGTGGVEAHLAMASGARVSARLHQRAGYQESARADGRSRHVGPPPAADSLVRRVFGRDDPPVQAIGAMLRDWLEAMEGQPPPRLPRFEDGVATVRAMEQLRAALAS
ncbi:MAG: Gfo/Idh/MocA family oxidoreductase [Dehalococcoidia bacterium]